MNMRIVRLLSISIAFAAGVVFGHLSFSAKYDASKLVKVIDAPKGTLRVAEPQRHVVQASSEWTW